MKTEILKFWDSNSRLRIFRTRLRPQPLSPIETQLSKLEEIRDGHDIEFKIMIKGMGGDGEYTNPVHDEWRVKISRSD